MSLKEEDPFKHKALTIFSGNTTEFQEFKDDFQDIAQSLQILHLVNGENSSYLPLERPDIPDGNAKTSTGLLEIYRQEMLDFKRQEKSINNLRQILIEGLDIHIKDNLFPSRAVLRTKNVSEIIHALIEKYGVETAADIEEATVNLDTPFTTGSFEAFINRHLR